MTKQIYIQLTEAQANTLLKVVETHPNHRIWGNLSRNDVTAEIRNGLSAGVRGDDVSESSVDDRIANMTFDNSNQGLDPIVQTPVEDETPEEDEAADGQIEDEAEADVETEEDDKSEDELLAEMLAEEEAQQSQQDEPLGSTHVDGDEDDSDR